MDTKNQLTNMLTKGSFTRVEWKSLLRLIDVSNLRSVSCFQTFDSANCPKIWSVRSQEEEKKNE